MELPRHVQRQADALNAFDAEIEARNAPQPAAADAAPAEPQADPAPEPEQPQAPETPAAPKPDRGAPTDPPVADATWEAKYRTLQGMFNAEVPKLHRQNAELQQQLEAIRKAQQEAPTQQQEPPVEEPAADPQLMSKAVETYGSELVEFIQRMAREEARASARMLKGGFDELRGRLDEITQGVGTVTQQQEQTAQLTFLGELAKRVPDYEAINVDDRFLQWLADVDELAGTTRQDLLNSAVQARDPARVAVFFNRFKADVGLPVTQAQPQPRPAQTQAQPQEQQPAPPSLARQAQPSRSSGSASTPPSQSQQVQPVSQAEIRKFFDDVTKGTYRGRDAEMQAREAAINAAVARGLVTG